MKSLKEMSKIFSVINRIFYRVKNILHDDINWTLESNTIKFGTGFGRIEFCGKLKPILMAE